MDGEVAGSSPAVGANRKETEHMATADRSGALTAQQLVARAMVRWQNTGPQLGQLCGDAVNFRPVDPAEVLRCVANHDLVIADLISAIRALAPEQET